MVPFSPRHVRKMGNKVMAKAATATANTQRTTANTAPEAIKVLRTAIDSGIRGAENADKQRGIVANAIMDIVAEWSLGKVEDRKCENMSKLAASRDPKTQSAMLAKLREALNIEPRGGDENAMPEDARNTYRARKETLRNGYMLACSIQRVNDKGGAQIKWDEKENAWTVPVSAVWPLVAPRVDGRPIAMPASARASLDKPRAVRKAAYWIALQGEDKGLTQVKLTYDVINKAGAMPKASAGTAEGASPQQDARQRKAMVGALDALVNLQSVPEELANYEDDQSKLRALTRWLCNRAPGMVREELDRAVKAQRDNAAVPDAKAKGTDKAPEADKAPAEGTATADADKARAAAAKAAPAPRKAAPRTGRNG